MDTADLFPLLEQLDDNVDDLEDVLQPFLGQSLSKTSKNLPVMDKAKLHVLITYTLESLIFSYLRLHGIDAKQHSVFRELTRVKQYFDKIKDLETEPEQRTMTLDKAAAGRFIKHGLAGNNKIDLELAEKQAKERARAQFKAAMLAKKQAAEAQSEDPSSAPPSTAQSGADSDDSDEDMSSEAEAELAKEKEKKQAKIEKANARSKNVKVAKKQGKLDVDGRKDRKKERRQKKEDFRKTHKKQ
ncbi:hypothetical protein N7448_010340 [Penicillium atrosanguineum]|uniref:Exosome complex protein n=1 Tax=Penicillium atrosanguineum TaxID=1132637 RepID=A0A9W9GG30_9EURO|nr:uncharacterized protein N7443_007565 [Penicillium atrosanguineum]KAJ5118635.1 hypothetical protein N7526_010272 [Penicillium atrosanguineum]KAJ5119671.1 hypothetical protein N7448_010340 [Penicillium atrosanguineum]KAJ5296672.1 hypothetical protein N7443_007565 [Penicillium atrosanguineum]KAJ5299434.1 hypothetical protein N7476_010991 [Penicillium atrosanguineum]